MILLFSHLINEKVMNVMTTSQNSVVQVFEETIFLKRKKALVQLQIQEMDTIILCLEVSH